MADAYCAVIGNPIAHSLSPPLYQHFAHQVGIKIRYERLCSPVDQFKETVLAFQAAGGCSLNVTAPFKSLALELADSASDVAQLAGASNLLLIEADSIQADNVDGAGLVKDIQTNWAFDLTGQSVLVLGAGGAVRGCLPILLAQNPAKVTVVNRTLHKAIAIQKIFPQIEVLGFEALNQPSFDVILNGTSASLKSRTLPIPDTLIRPETYCYDLSYSLSETVFLQQCREHGSQFCRDGLGMLIEQGAQAFYRRFGQKPETKNLLNDRAWLTQ
jgi:shikimate dehydrogenase